MTLQQIIDNYCRLYGAIVPEISPDIRRYFLTVTCGEAKVFPIRDRSVLLGRIIGNAMKHGIVLHVDGRKIAPVTWEEWTQLWQTMFVPPKRDKRPVPNYKRPYKSEIFRTMQQERPARKPQKHGFMRSFIANASMELL